ncbi:MAG: hypothetical protein DRP87_09065 [Spirochaetes bacterium]|nr:MAG: hypothetical protein DRP87_09065 [Spirochaetota bacterium]
MTRSFASGLACMTATEEDQKKVEEVLLEMKELNSRDEDSMIRYRNLNHLFHSRLVTPCQNKYLVKMHENALKRVKWCYNLSILRSRDFIISYEEHKEIFKAFISRNRLLVENLIREHVANAGIRFQAEYEKKKEA